MYKNQTVRKFRLIEVQINPAASKIMLPNDDILREKRVTGIEVYGRDAGGNGKSPLNRTLISDQALAESYLTFMCDNNEVLAQIPLQKIKHDPDDKQVLQLDLIGISPTKSFIEFADTASIANTQSVILGIYYED